MEVVLFHEINTVFGTGINDITNNNNYLQLLYREVKGILLYQWFPRPILSTKHPERSEECFVDKLVLGTCG